MHIKGVSEEKVTAFGKMVDEDKDLLEKLKAADSEEKFFDVVKDTGFELTKEERQFMWKAHLDIQNPQRVVRKDKTFLYAMLFVYIAAGVLITFGLWLAWFS